MLRVLTAGIAGTVLAACALRPGAGPGQPAAVPAASWGARLASLQIAGEWQLEGRVAVAFGTQGWQATLNRRQAGALSDVRLAGPLGIGAVVLQKTADGISLNGAPASGPALLELEQRLGFTLPLDELRFWLLGVPAPGTTFDLSLNEQDRAQSLDQAGWSVTFEQYLPAGGDLLPSRLILSHAPVRVRIAVDRWQAAP
ncbi:MAG: lipoprotein insertase outer membrane protein LolB [Pseudomonadota bacterium]|nr:lipoprotein insertase outer membrane protein LolB [Pseudomonadota bacterium]